MVNNKQKINFKIGHLNTRSLLAGFNDLSYMVIHNSFDAFLVSETWLSADVPSDTVMLPGYTLFRNDRRTGRGGGVAAYIKSKFISEQIPIDIQNNNNVEHIWIRIKLNKSYLALGVVYRPPQSNIADCIETLDNILSYLMPSYETVVVTGDVNINLFNLNNPLTQCFDAYGFSQVIDEPTRVTQFTSTLIDPIFVNDHTLVKNCGTLNADIITDHRFVFCEIIVDIHKRVQKMHTFRSFKYFNKHLFDIDLNNISWQDILYMDNIESKVEFLTNNILALFDVHAPVQTVRMNKQHSPWLTDAVKLIMRERDRAFSTYKSNNTENNWQNYKNLRNFAVTAVRREKAAYLKYLHENDVTNMWKSLKAMNVQRKSNIELPDSMGNPTEINNFFLGAFNINSANADTINFYKDRTFNASHEFSFALPDQHQILEVIYGLKSNACGVDGISLHMVKLCLPLLLPYITHVINCCLENGYFPETWKQAVVCPVPKVNNPTQYNDLRPISLLPIFSKILEKIISIQLHGYFTEKQMLPLHQSGFRPGHSTVTALVNISDNILNAQDKKLATALVLLDFSKAFDSVDHSLLCAKLGYYGLNNITVSFFQSYLNGRTQSVRTRVGNSSSELVRSGVPQGSILGPLLFLIYTMDIYECVTFTEMQSYADDTQLKYSFNPNIRQPAVNSINHDLAAISTFCKNHALKINPLKSQVVLFCPKNLYNVVKASLVLKIENEVIPIVEHAKNLGVIFDRNFKFIPHVNNLIKKSYVSLRLLYSNRHILNFKIRKKICESIVFPIFHYCDIVYYPCLDSATKYRIQRVQNTCCRFVYGLRKFDHVSRKIQELKWLKFDFAWKYHFLVFVHRLLTTSTPTYLRKKLVHREQIHAVNIRGNRTLTMPHHTSAVFQKSFTFNAVKHYNSLHHTFKSYSINSFRRHLKVFLLNSQ